MSLRFAVLGLFLLSLVLASPGCADKPSPANPPKEMQPLPGPPGAAGAGKPAKDKNRPSDTAQ